jgi:hypothetical protein
MLLIGIGIGTKVLWQKLRSAPAESIAPPINNPSRPKDSVDSKKLAPALIAVNDERQFMVGRDTLNQVVMANSEDRRKRIAKGAVRNLLFESPSLSGSRIDPANVSTNQFFSLAEMSIPDLLLRTLEPVFMAGLFGETTSTTPFIILKVSDKDIGIAGMLDMEAKLPILFNNVFGSAPITATDTQGKFRGTIVGEHDARILEHKSETIVYAFADTFTIVITQSKSALESLLPMTKNN